jgi:hypothetical protein
MEQKTTDKDIKREKNVIEQISFTLKMVAEEQ